MRPQLTGGGDRAVVHEASAREPRAAVRLGQDERKRAIAVLNAALVNSPVCVRTTRSAGRK